ncbi:MAG: porin family protein [Hydrogenophaga sp.]|jgi:hypothetical protein|nr:porin family protein [Hydrogenophaga sp.]
MMNKPTFFVLSALGAAMIPLCVHAGMVTDADGNVGYDTLAECDAAVLAGTARFYKPVTTMPPLRRQGEVSVRTAKLSDLGPEYANGACDLGVGRKDGRNGVSRALRGKYVPYSPDMPINLYSNAQGVPVRASMAQCDNRFSSVKPRPVPVAAAPAPAPVAMPAPAPAPAPAPVAAAPAPAVAAPAPTPAPAPKGMTPYIFGTLGMVNDSAIYRAPVAANSVGATDRQIGGQFGAGLQFNSLVGAEVFYQGGKDHEYPLANGVNTAGIGLQALGARLTLGGNVTEKLRLFGKIGAARVTHDSFVGGDESKTRGLIGIGATYLLNTNLSLRLDADHYPRMSAGNNPRWGNVDYFGVGLQYSF